MRRTASLLWIGLMMGLFLAGPGGLLTDVSAERGPECADPKSEVNGVEEADQAVIVKLATARYTYSVGDVAPLALVAVPREEEEELFFRTSQRFDVFATREGNVVWRWSAGRVFLMVLGWETLLRDDPALYVLTWDLRDNEGEYVPPGEYQLHGVLAAEDPVHSAPVAIQVEAPPE